MRRVRRASAVGLAAVAATVAVTVALAAETQSPRTDEVPLPVFEGTQSAWSPDSQLIAVPEAKAISLRGLDGSVQRRLRGAGIDYFDFPCEDCLPKWSEDGAQIQFLSHEEQYESDDWVVGQVAVDGSGVQHRGLGVPVGAAAWAPAGWPLIYIPNARTITGLKGKRVGPRPDLWRLDSLYAKPRKILESRAEEEDPLFSPDGTRIAFMRVRERSSSLWTASAEGTAPRRLVGSLLGPSFAAWSPDGRTIALTTFSRRKGDRRCHLYVLAADGGRVRQIVKEEILPRRPAWTPNGRWITFANYEGDIRKIRPDGTGLQTVASFPGKEIHHFGWSPDGQHLSYSARPFPRSD